MSRAAMWGPVDAAVRCALPLLLRKIAYAKSTGTYLKSQDWIASLLSLAERLTILPSITSRSAADHAWIDLTNSAVGQRHVRFGSEEGSAPVFRSVGEVTTLLGYAGAGRAMHALTMAAFAIYGARESLLGNDSRGQALLRLHAGGERTEIALAAAYWESAIRGLCEEVANEPRLLMPKYETALAEFAILALERADHWLKRVAPGAWLRVSALR